jgi:hypothetical protein
MSPNGYFLLMVLGVPVAILAVAMLAGRLHRGGYERVLDWKATRSPEREAELTGDTQQMLAALNRHRRLRGAPERTLADITKHSWAELDH